MMDVSAKKAKSLKNAEKRRERSKVAARCRRGKECEIFNDLSDSLPICESSKDALDKASVMRLTLCHLKLKQMMDSAFWMDDAVQNSSFNEEFDSLLNNALGGFILVSSLDGDIIFASEGITTQLGISQFEIMGQSIFDFSHQYDHNDIRNLLMFKKGEMGKHNQRSGLFRMKCTVTSRGRNAHLRTANYKVINCIGRLMEDSPDKAESERWFVCICEPLLHPSDVDIPLNKQTFLSKHTPDMKFEYVDESISVLMGYKPEEMLGKSLFEFNHAADGEGIAKSFKSLYQKEQNQTERYRFLTKGGGWMWIITQATVIQGSNGKSPNSVVCIHFITSGREETDQILSEVQLGEIAEAPLAIPVSVPIATPLPLRILTEKVNPKTNIPVVKLNSKPNLHTMSLEEENSFIADLLVGPLLNQATCSTSKIFTPKTDDMDTGFLMPMDDTLIVSKEEPADLTHLAPIAGDTCVPLDVPLLEDLLASLDKADNMAYTLLDPESDEIPSLNMIVKPAINTATATSLPIQKTGSNSSNGSFSLLDSSPLLFKSDPSMVAVASPDSRSPLSPFSDSMDNSDICSSSPSNENESMNSNSELSLCSSPLLSAQMDDSYFSGRVTPLPQEIAVPPPPQQPQVRAKVSKLQQAPAAAAPKIRNFPIPMEVEPGGFSGNKFLKRPTIGTVESMDQDEDQSQVLLGGALMEAQDQDGPDWSLITEANRLMKKSGDGYRPKVSTDGPTSTKMTRLLPPELDRFGNLGCDTGDQSQPRVFILLPVQPRGSSMTSDSNQSGSDSEASNETTSFDLVDLVKGSMALSNTSDSDQIRQLLTQIGVDWRNPTKPTTALGASVPPSVQNSNIPKPISKQGLVSVSPAKRIRKRDFAGSLLCDRQLSLHELTRQDCEVNAPLTGSTELLQGPDILQALDMETGLSSVV